MNLCVVHLLRDKADYILTLQGLVSGILYIDITGSCIDYILTLQGLVSGILYTDITGLCIRHIVYQHHKIMYQADYLIDITRSCIRQITY